MVQCVVACRSVGVLACSFVSIVLQFVAVWCSVLQHIALCGVMDSCGVATISRLLKIIGLFCRILSLL